MILPNFEEAVIPIEKLRDYCLNSEHPEGKHKAKVFKAKLGLESKDAELLKQLILNAIKVASAVESFRDEYGVRFYSDITISVKDVTAELRTSWIIKTNETIPRLSTCYIKT